MELNQDTMPAAHAHGLASATRRILSLLSLGEILLQLARESAALSGCTRALGSYVASHQPWIDGIHVQIVAGTPIATTPAQRSAVYGIYRQLARERRLKSIYASSQTEAIFQGLGLNGAIPSSVCALPIHGHKGRIGGVVLLVDHACAETNDDVLQAITLLCTCASTAIENAQRFTVAKRNQERLFVFSETTEEALWDLDLETGEIWWGGAVQTLYRGAAIDLGQTLAWKEERIHAGDRERVRAAFAQALDSSESSWQDIYRFERADGTFATVEDRAHMLRDINGHPRRVVGRLRDITELLAAYERETEAIRAREQSEERLRLAVEAASVGVWDTDLVTGRRVANELYYDLCGLARNDTDGMAEMQLIHPDERPCVQERMTRALSPHSLGAFESEHRIIRRIDGRERWVKARGRVHVDSMGHPVRFVGALFDISDRKYAEQRWRLLADAGERLTRSLDSKSTLAAIADLAIHDLADWCFVEIFSAGGVGIETAVAHADPERVRFAAQVRIDCPTEPLAPWGPRRVMHTGQLEYHPEITEALLTQWESTESSPGLARSLGLRSLLTVPMIARGHIAGAISLAMAESGRRFSPPDIPCVEELARRAAMAVENARLYRQAQEAVELRDEFLSIASHELKTPLTPLRLQVENVRRALDKAGLLEDRIAARLEQINRQTQRLTTLVDSLLDVSRISAGRLSLELESAELGEIVAEVVQRFADEARAARSPIALHIEDRAFGCWDRLRIEQVLANLISNAIKYGKGHPITIRVRVDDEVRIAVEDQGIGINQADMSRIFGRFERAASLRHFGGLGLGLYIARQIVEAHGGSITVTSAPAEGSTFTVNLPLNTNALPRVVPTETNS